MTETERPLRLVVIIGSTREGRAGAAIARWFITHANQHAGFDVDVIDLRDAALPAHLPEGPTPEQEVWTERVDRADAFVVVTPEYNHSFPAALKQAIDSAYEQWFAKPVGFVSYGGVARGLRAVEALRLVFAEVHATTIRNAVGIGLEDGVDAAGWVSDPDAGRAAKVMLDQLHWWGRALCSARADRPYVA
jgi:NAD(P)H-dependent FMN reductase